tara:strand:+ start:300 stop:593 length:294 start_codon:yes stop_codon:yes gene_type:complete
MTKENKEWMRHAIYLGEDSMNHFSDTYWETIGEPMNYLPLGEQCIFYQAYVGFGGKDDLTYDNYPAFALTIQYAQDKIYGALIEIEKRFNLNEGDEQ